MSVESNKLIARRFRDEIWNTGNLAIADEICAANAIFHINDPLTPHSGSGPSVLKQTVTLYRTALPDAQVTIEDIIAEGDRVVIRWTGRGTHRGNLGNIPPSGKSATTTGIDIIRIAGGKIEEAWVNWDTMGMMQQLGALQQKGQTSS